MTDLRHLQLVILSILKDIDNFCNANNIQYYLAYGSALGAIRHNGFIPWDDDIDIVMDNKNYQMFISIAKKEFQVDKYFIEEGLKDWPMPFSKVRLRGTTYCELESYDMRGENGIYVDVFKMDNVSSNKYLAKWQYICAKYYLCYTLSQRSFKSAPFYKKLLMWSAFPLKIKVLREFILGQVEKYNDKETEYYGCFYTRYGFHGSVIPCRFYGKPAFVDFENLKMPVPENWNAYLTYIYGHYMTLSPEKKQIGLHLTNIDFGEY